jgi:ribonuclease Z
MTELRLIFLGTGSGRPTPKRNVSAMYLRFGGRAVLFDCGEGTQMQLLHSGARSSRLDAICISHFHGDHINGLPGFIGTMGLSGHTDPLTLIGPRGMPKYLRALHDLSILRPGFVVDVVENREGLLLERDDYTLEGVKLSHRLPTHGFIFRERDLLGRFDLEKARALEIPAGPLYGRLQRGEAVQLDDGREISPDQVVGPTRRGRSVAYMCDTRPSERVVEAVAGVDVLVHEATYLHEFASQARERGHSTVREAAEVARDAQVDELVLTHISPKHGSKREILREAREVFAQTRLANDFDTIDVPIPE